MQKVERTRVPFAHTGRRLGGLCVCILMLAGLTGCTRYVVIHKAGYINTAMHRGREAGERKGEPLELAIVCLYPSDIKKPGNEDLDPSRPPITSKEWYERCPDRTKQVGRYDIPYEQIYICTDRHRGEVFGQYCGPSLVGSVYDDATSVEISIEFKRGWHGTQASDKDSVIYVFGKFRDERGVLRVPPAKFNPPGRYGPKLHVEVGVDPDDRSLAGGQFIRVRQRP